jgi:hypothetical protein
MKDYTRALEAIEEKIDSIKTGSPVRLAEIIGNYKEKKIIDAAKMLLMKYGIQYEKERNTDAKE